MKTPKILIIDDNQNIRLLLKAALKHTYEVSEAADGEEALRLLDGFRPDLIILDIMLPGMSGIEIGNLIKTHPHYKDIPIIGLSAKVGTAARTEAYEHGFNNYLEKPFEVSELKAVVNTTLKLKEAEEVELIYLDDLVLNKKSRMLTCNNQQFKLTPKEFDIMNILINKANMIVTREDLMKCFGSADGKNSDRSLDNFIGSLRKKIQISDSEIKTHYSLGYELTRKKAA